jgi:hypothetical protein
MKNTTLRLRTAMCLVRRASAGIFGRRICHEHLDCHHRHRENFFGISVPNGFAFPPDNVISWQLHDPTATVLSSEALPTVLPVLSDWQSIFGLDIFSDNLGDMFLIRSDVTSAVLIPDSDGDGVPDSSDLCPGTLQGAVVNAEGCSIDQLVPCTGPASGGTWKNHGQYVSTVQGIAREFLDNGLLTSEDRNSILREAAKSSCGKRH